MKSKHIIPVFFVLMVCVGCSSKTDVVGRVTFPDNTPLTTGFVYFESGSYQAYGVIDADGRYQIGEIQPGDGIKKGEYRVRVSATSGGTTDGAPYVRHVAEKYENTETSGLTCTVDKKTQFDIQVEKP